MEIGTYGYEKSELLTLAEQIYQCKHDIEDLELELNEVQFHYTYIGKRKDIVTHEVIFRLLFILICTGILLGCVVVPIMLNLFLFTIPFLLIADFMLIKREIKMLLTLSYSSNPERAGKFAQHFHIVTFQSDTIQTKKKIQELQERIKVCNDKLEGLQKKKQEYIEKQQQKEEILRKNGILYDEKPNVQNSKFNLKMDDAWTNDIQELDEYYRKEEAYLGQLLANVDRNIQLYNREITKIDSEFEQSKKLLLLAVIVFVLVAIIQNSLSSVAYTVSAIVCVIVSIISVIILENKCRIPIINYYVEQKSPLFEDYAFTHNMVPVAEKRQEYMECREKYEKELTEVKNKRKALDA